MLFTCGTGTPIPARPAGRMLLAWRGLDRSAALADDTTVSRSPDFRAL
jgi:hypothetical protein